MGVGVPSRGWRACIVLYCASCVVLSCCILLRLVSSCRVLLHSVVACLHRLVVSCCIVFALSHFDFAQRRKVTGVWSQV